LMRLESDLVDLIDAALGGWLGEAQARWSEKVSVGVVLAAGGYPEAPRRGLEIRLGSLERPDVVKIFHGGTVRDGSHLRSDGGRVLCVTALGATLAQARARAYDALKSIHLEGGFCRRDIGAATG
jgi:phosphoribosylamine---glycine ligase